MKIRRGLIRFLVLLLAALPVMGVFTAPSSAATSRVAVIKSLSGTVQVKKSGGSKQFKAFAKMSLNEGDVLTTSANSSAVLQFANGTSEDDQMTVSADSTLTFSKLSDRNGTRTKVSMLKGNAWVDVKSINSKNDEFTLETPTAIMGVRGTHFFVIVDPVTGATRLAVAAGEVNAQPPGGAGANVMPGEEGLLGDGDDVYIAPSDLDALLKLSSAEIIEAILNASAEIARENSEKMNQYFDGENGPGSNSPNELDRLRSNIENLIGAIIQSAANSGKITPGRVQELVSQAESRAGTKIDQTKKDINLSEEQKRKQAELKRLEEMKRQQAEQKKQLEEQQRLKQEELIKKLEEEKKKKEEEQQRVLEEKRKQAEADYEKGLSDAEKQRFQDAKKQREQEQTGTPAQSNPSGSASDPSTPTPIRAFLSSIMVVPTANGSMDAYTVNMTEGQFEYLLPNAAANVDSVVVKPMTQAGSVVKSVKVNGYAVTKNIQSDQSEAYLISLASTNLIEIVVQEGTNANRMNTYKFTMFKDEPGTEPIGDHSLTKLSIMIPLMEGEELSWDVPLSISSSVYSATLPDMAFFALVGVKAEEDHQVKLTVNGIPTEYIYDESGEFDRVFYVPLFSDYNELIIQSRPTDKPDQIGTFTLKFNRASTLPYGIGFSTNPEMNWSMLYPGTFVAFTEQPVSSITFTPEYSQPIVAASIECYSENCDGVTISGNNANGLAENQLYEFAINYYIDGSETAISVTLYLVNGHEAEPQWNPEDPASLFEFKDRNNNYAIIPSTYDATNDIYVAHVPYESSDIALKTYFDGLFGMENEEDSYYLTLWDDNRWEMLDTFGECQGMCIELEPGVNTFLLYVQDGFGMYSHQYTLRIVRGESPAGIQSWSADFSNGVDSYVADWQLKKFNYNEYFIATQPSNGMSNVKLNLSLDKTRVSSFNLWGDSEVPLFEGFSPGESAWVESIDLGELPEGMHKYTLQLFRENAGDSYYDLIIIVGSDFVIPLSVVAYANNELQALESIGPREYRIDVSVQADYVRLYFDSENWRSDQIAFEDEVWVTWGYEDFVLTPGVSYSIVVTVFDRIVQRYESYTITIHNGEDSV